ncbi:MAG: GlxA family transcriptional regulator [Pseudomonadales bacterium]
MPTTTAAPKAKPDTSPAQLSVGFVLLPHFTLLPFAAFIDALRLAADVGDQSRQINCQWTVMGADLEEIDSSCGVNVRPWETFREPKEFDYIVVVGGLLHQGPTASKAVQDYLRLAAKQRVTLVGLCTGSFALIRAGLMSGRRCCVSWFHYQDLLAEFTDVIPVADRLYVDDGDRITCSGGTVAADLASLIIERHLGRDWARKSLSILGMDEARSSNAAQPRPTNEYTVKDERVKRALLIMQQNMERPLSSAEIAKALSLSTRQMERLFVNETKQSMQRSYRNIRLGYGLWLLENSSRSVTDIAQECGFADTAHFSRAFKALFDRRPSETRQMG